MAHDEHGSDGPEPIAVVGLSFKFAGNGDNADSFWDMLLAGRCAAKDIPPDRFNADSFYHPDTSRLDTLPIRQAHFLEGDISAFDAPFFSITGPEAAAMDPQSRLLLETSYRALENAGISLEKCAGSRTSVYIGCSSDDYNMIYVKDPELPIRHAATGKAASMLANKISWFFDFRGPSIRIDTACSASLNALHLARQSLQTGESDMSLVGGVNLFLTPESVSPLAHLNFLSPDNRCFSFDHRANGYSRGEGSGIIVIKRLSAAIEDGDTIRAVIRASGSNENGRSAGAITRVSKVVQEDLVHETYARGGLSLKETRYVEAHAPGTGGDEVETAALAAVFGKHRNSRDPLCLGSVKANIGHLEGGSGMASLIKTVLMLERGIMPRLANFEDANPKIQTEAWNLKLPVENVLWPSGLRRASVNSFGFGGSNAHVVIEDAYHHLRHRGLHGNHSTQVRPALHASEHNPSTTVSEEAYLGEECRPQAQNNLGASGARLLVLSAVDESGATRIAKAYSEHINCISDLDPNSAQVYLNNLAYTLTVRRTHLPWRSFMIACQLSDARGMEMKISKAVRSSNKPQLGFVFTGQGAQYAQMGLELFPLAGFRASLESCRRYLQSFGCAWDLFEELSRELPNTNINRPDYSQPICTALQIALVDLLFTYGIRPAAVVGHSSGEIAAAYCAGALSRQAACKIAYYRGLYAARIAKYQHECGMMTVGLSKISLLPYLEELDCRSASREIWVGCFNSPKNLTLTGNTTQLQDLQSRLERDSIFARALPVDVAYHSPFMTAISEDYEADIGTVEHGIMTDETPVVFSTLAGKKTDIEKLRQTRYWSQNLISPVLFAQALEQMISSEFVKDNIFAGSRLRALVEIGPHAALRAPIGEILDSLSKRNQITYTTALTRKTSAIDSFLGLQGQLHCIGYAINWKAPRAYGKYPVSLTNLPEYPFNHDRSYWHESRLSRNYRMRKHARSDLLGVRVPDWNPLEARWRNIIRKLENPWVEDHRIDGVAVYPGAGMLVMAIEAAAQLARDSDDRNPTGFHLKDVTFPNSLNISSQPEGVETEIHLRTLKDAADRQVTWCEFRLCLLKNGEWNDTCRGQILVEYEDPANEVDNGKELHERVKYYGGVHQSAMRECNKPSDPKKVYQSLERYGLSTGPTFRVLQDICYSGMQEARAKILSHQWTLKANPDHSQPHFVHPTALDGVMQLGIVALSNGGTDNVPTMVPSRIRKLWVSSSGLSGADFPYVIGSAKAAYRGYRETNIDVLVVDKDGALPRIVAEGLETIIIGDRAPTTSSVRQLSYKVRWMPDLDLLDNDTILAYSERQAQCSGAQEQQATGGANGAATELLPLMVVLTASMHKKPDLKILEVALSDGRYEDPGPTFISGGTDKLSQLLPESIQYDYIIMAEGAINGEGAASVRDKASNQIRDSAQIVYSQVLKSDSYDIVIMQTKELAKDAVVAMQDNLQKLIRQDGKVICFTSSKDLSPNEVHMEEYLSLYDSGGTNLGFAGQIDTVESKARFSMANPMKWVKSSVLCVPPVVILIATKSTLQQELAANIKSCLTSRGISNVKVLGLAEASSSASLKEAHHIFVTEVDLPFMAQLRPEEYMLLQNIVLNAVSILWISSTQQQQIEASSSIIVGLARTLRTERTDLKFVTVELETVSIHKVRTTQHIMKVFEQTISKPVEELEPEYVERDSMLYIGRVVRDDRMNQEISSRIAARKDEERAFGSHQALALGIANPGLLDSLRFEVDPDASRDLSPYEIEVEPAFSGLNFMDCLVALGRVPQNTLGVECAGTVVRSGERSDLVRGDRVMLCTNGTIRSRARCHCKSAIKIPDDLSFREAAALPGTAATVYHALHNIAHLQAGESILIHAGAGATGQMAIQMATQVGAIVYTTVGSKEKKAFVMGNYEIPESNIFYSRNASFAQKIKRITNGQGVDVVLNSLAGDSLVASWESIASFGRFIDIGKRDIYAHKTLPMYPFAKNTSFSVVDLAAIWSQRPEMMRRIFEAVLDMWVKGDLHVAQPLHVFPVSKVEDAFRLLQSGKSMGKLIIEMNEGDVVPTSLKVEPAYTFPADASYVIAGGLGGLGRSIARWMAGRGVKNLILLSRSGANSDTARALLEELTERGVRVVTPPCDITDGDALSQALTKCKNMPPIKGCIQATMVLKDKYFSDMQYSEWHSSTNPKILGSWNLHNHLPKGMSFFILLSSMAGIIGGPGQANYAAGNTYEDALARYRVSIGERAVSLDLGMMTSEGVLAENQKLMKALDSTGAYMHMTIAELRALLDRYCDPEVGLLRLDEAQVVCGIELPSVIRAKGMQEPSWMTRPPFRHFYSINAVDQSSTAHSSGQATDYKSMFACSPSLSHAGTIVSDALVGKLSHSLSIPNSDIDSSKPIHYYGVDSLVAVELRNWFAKELLSDVPVFDILGNKSCGEIGLLAAERSAFRKQEWEGDEEETISPALHNDMH